MPVLTTRYMLAGAFRRDEERDDEVVIFSTGSGMKHTELIPTGPDAFPVLDPTAPAFDLAAAIRHALL